MISKDTVICRCCREKPVEIFSGRLIGYSIRYYECLNCGYVQTETPYWLDKAYAAAINASDTGIIARNQSNCQIVLATTMLLGILKGTVVDCAGGYGILVRMLRDAGVNALWSDRYCNNLVARGFEYADESADLVTAFEAFEHYVDPAVELDRLLAIAPNVLLSTELIQYPTPRQNEWWYYGKEHGQHIGFFRLKTLEWLVARRGKFFISNGTSYHLISSKPVNKEIWLAFLRMNRYMLFIVRRILKSRIWEDHLAMSESNE